MLNQITKYLMISLVLSLGFGQLLRFEIFGVPLYFHDIIVLAILCLRTVLTGIPGLKLFGVALVLSSIRALTLYPPSSLLVPSLYLIRLLSYIALYIVLKNSKLKISKSYFYLAGVTTLIIGLLQYFYLPDMRIFQYLGWDDHLFRLTLPHFDPTFTAVMLGLVLLSFPHFVPIFLLGILLTYSRSIWLSLVITAISFIRPVKYLLIIPVFFLAIFLLPNKFGEGTNLLRTFSISSRFQSDMTFVTKYKWDLVIGRGFNTLVLDASKSLYENHATGPNNSYLYLLTTSGVLGLVGWGMFMKYLYTRSSHKPMLMFFFIASLFNNVMFYPFALLWVLLLETMAPTSD